MSIDNQQKILKVLIANRSEIALRIHATCHSLGIKTVAVYSPEDILSAFVYKANEAHPLSKNGSSAYMEQDEIIAIALKTGSNAIHPGYGFLSENALFAQKVTSAGLTWIGPSYESIRQMGNKNLARNIMKKAGVAVVPGQEVTIDETGKNQALQIADQIGYPVILKDPLSGGGKAMRKIQNQNDFESAWKTVVSESKKLTKSTHLLIEKYIESGRHIEVQFAGDGQNFIHFFERECSIQRRHQKVIEEAPCKFVKAVAIEKMYQSALIAANAVSYKNIGTVEFLVTPQDEFYFLEMNTRLQVEHSVTELTCGIDLVALQFHIAETGKLPLDQEHITRKGHAIECRIYAEDPDKKFMPATGKILHLELPEGAFFRHDHDLYEGKEITPFFDPMISKITTFGQTRQLARRYMYQALDCFNIVGVKANINFLKHLLLSNEFISGNFDTQLLNDTKLLEKIKIECSNDAEESKGPLNNNEIALVVAMLTSKHATNQNSFKGNIQSTKNTASNTTWKASQWK